MKSAPEGFRSSPGFTAGEDGEGTYRRKPPLSKPPGRLYSQLAGFALGMRESSGEAVKQPDKNIVLDAIATSKAIVFFIKFL